MDKCQSDDLIVDYASFEITSSGLNDFIQHVAFRPSYEECSVLVDMVKEFEEINITIIQKTDGFYLKTESVKSLDIMYRSICKADIDRTIASKIQESMHLYSNFSRSELCPRPEFRTKTYGTAIEGVNYVVNVKSELIFCIQEADSFNESLTKVSVYMPVPLLVCFCKSISWNSIAEAAMIQFILNCNQISLNVSKSILRSILRKTHYEKLIVAGQIPGTIVSLVSSDSRVEVSTRYKHHKLSKYGFSCEHGQKDKFISPKLRFKSRTRKFLCN